MVFKKFTGFLLDLFFPKFCFGCQREGDYLCQDCRAILEISRFHRPYSSQNLKDLYFALNYQSPLIKNLIQKFKYPPLVKELAKSLAFLIIEHLQLLDNKPSFRDFKIIPIPLEKRKLKRRGFNQAEEIGKELAKFFKIPLINNVLIKTKETLPQVELSEKEREDNIKGAFSYQQPALVKDKKILLVDDVYTTGSTMEEAAKVLKKAGAKEIIGLVVARAKPGDDQF